MAIETRPAAVEEILRWRDLYRHEMNCQIIHDSLHSRPGWTQPYLLTSGAAVAGYGSVAIAGPWKDEPTLFEFYLLPRLRDRAFDFFAALLAASRVRRLEIQSNDSLITAMLHTFARDVVSDAILFEDGVATAHPLDGAVFRRATPEDATRYCPDRPETVGPWVLDLDGAIVATGGVLFHYNRPYGDLYMEVAEPRRRQGFGTRIVQELKRLCYQQGNQPAARCNPSNVASRKTLQKAGFVPCGHRLTGVIPG